MFPCACSLRSTQCAALIALAAAAGIMRIERPPSENGLNSFTPRTTESVAVSVELEKGNRNAHYEFANAFAPWLRLAQLAAELSALSDAESSLAPPVAPFVKPRFSVSPPPRLSAAQHAFPFAVGPPRPAATLLARADDTRVSRDSAARRVFVSRIADLPSANFARTSRNENRVLTGTVSVFNPSSALRGGLAGVSSLRRFDEPMGSFCPHPCAKVTSLT